LTTTVKQTALARHAPCQAHTGLRVCVLDAAPDGYAIISAQD